MYLEIMSRFAFRKADHSVDALAFDGHEEAFGDAAVPAHRGYPI